MTVAELSLEIAQASRILALHGILDAFGHVSCRDPRNDACFLMSRSLAPKLVTPDDIVSIDLEGEAPDRPDTQLFIERYIHAEIYRARPDVRAIVHSHAAAVLPFTVAKSSRVSPLCHVCGFLSGIPETYDIADHFGPATDLLIRDPGKGRSLAAHLGGANVIMMRGHGFTAVGGSVPQATFRTFYTNRNCEIQLMAQHLGAMNALSDAEAAACELAVNGQINRAWSLWVSDLAGD
ncbi:class II aldolase/adducin family protein [Sphingomonas sp.]|uniref:class II aldolase/adducin family protein n=1 Tax=Sphingomonas sp. TaxID=28214 RepID=UPI000DB74F5E|nr:class II aldolase/adducin family protein [Sphingomonas sp.]PZU09091.1 MAG: aldolase [Sphingomonas sp.]